MVPARGYIKLRDERDTGNILIPDLSKPDKDGLVTAPNKIYKVVAMSMEEYNNRGIMVRPQCSIGDRVKVCGQMLVDADSEGKYYIANDADVVEIEKYEAIPDKI